jgi:hypothetical protein
MKGPVAAYAALVLGVALLMRQYGAPAPVAPADPPAKGDEAMQWAQSVTVKVPAKPAGIWTWAVDPIQGPARVKIEAAPGASWIYSPGKPCGADGDLVALLAADHALYAKAPIGALLVKIGGSTAGAADGTIRVAGSKTYFEIPEATTAPLFLTINDELGGMGDNSGEIEVTVSIHPLPKPAPAAQPEEPAAPAAGGESP